LVYCSVTFKLENKVAGSIKEEADKAKISDKFEEIIVPTP
jgi:hypothetical protein